MKNTFAFWIDVIFVGFITFILSLVAFYFFIPHPYTLIYSSCVAFLAIIFFFAKLDKRRKDKLIKCEEEKEKDKLVSELNFSSHLEQNAILERAFKNNGLNTERKRGAIFIKEKNALVLCRFSFNKINKADIVKAFNLIGKNQKAFLLAENFDDEVQSFSQRFDGNVVLLNGEKVYKYLKDNEALPKNFKYQCYSEKKKKGSFKNLLDKKKSKTFFVFGLLFLLFSYISPLKIYYIICGCLFLIYSLVLRIFGKTTNLSAQTDNI